jgi:hypothetical protein
MTRYVIGPDVATRLAHERAVISDEHRILAPTLLRSHVLSSLYQAVQRGELTRTDAEERLNYIRGLRIQDALVWNAGHAERQPCVAFWRKRGCQRGPAQPREPGRQRRHHLLQPRTGSAAVVDG